MTIKGESFSSAPTEHEVMSAYAASAEPDVPIAYATSIESQSPPPYISEPQTSSYSTGASNIALPTGAPIIRAANQPGTAVATPQQQGGQTRAANEPGCCNGRTCCFIFSIIFTIICLCCLLPVIIILIVAATAANTINEFDDAVFSDDVWKQVDQGYGN
eukprot:CAMPEP_0116092978 /NCGR_PEP_ID=MMETSP0327-20121206/8342_1 /TAXON_ID=44447 /ORGANISM="Pseudo-nitzschia delicatissima, Strain B596" /LENGTH=159 /DNA_ID=CAMNT_0003584463 /DNA_START=153 /DNA_END=632 /DNA_ORIENTATION=-